MKKLYLLAAAAIMGANLIYAEEPSFSLTKDWSVIKTDQTGNNELEGFDRTRDWSKDQITSKNCVRYATAMNGKIYFVNMKTMSIAEFTPEGEIKDLYKLPALSGDDFYGTALTHDDAGHFLVGHYFTDQKSSYIWTIYDPESGDYKHLDVTPKSIPAYGRIDCVGRVCGDLTKDAFVYVSSRAWNADKSKPLTDKDIKIYCIEFENLSKTGKIKDVEATGEFSPMVYVSSAYNSIAQPRYSKIDDLLAFLENDGSKISDTFYSYSTAYGTDATVEDYWPMFYTFENGALVSGIGENFNSFASSTGFDTFELNGHRYFVINYLSKEDATKHPEIRGTMDVAVYDENQNLLATWSNPEWKAGSAYTSVIAEPIDDTTAKIYTYACAGAFNGGKYGDSAIGGAKLTFKAEGVSGIEDIVAGEEELAPVYYNLQGVEVANPENGIYIVRRGNKVTKEVIR